MQGKVDRKLGYQKWCTQLAVNACFLRLWKRRQLKHGKVSTWKLQQSLGGGSGGGFHNPEEQVGLLTFYRQGTDIAKSFDKGSAIECVYQLYHSDNLIRDKTVSN